MTPVGCVAVVMAMFGLLIGSFLNVVVYRLQIMMEAAWAREVAEFTEGVDRTPSKAERFNLAWPPSRCSSCQTRITVWQNVPVLSYLWLRGRCGACRQPIGVRYPLVELTMGAMFGIIGWHFGSFDAWPAIVAYATLCAMLLVLALIDADTYLLPDVLTLPLLWLGLLASVAGLTIPLDDAVIGAASGYLALWMVATGYQVTMGRDGIGAGDLKLVAALGAWLGWMMLPLVLVLGALLSAVTGGLILWRRGEGLRTPLPFGPSLVVAGFITLVWGWPLIEVLETLATRIIGD